MRVYSATNIGMKRKMNQDYVFASQDTVGNLPNLFAVADGMGGHNAGDYASSHAVRILVDEIREDTDYNPVKVIRHAIETANTEIIEQAQKDEKLRGMGTTMVVATIVGQYAYIANVGDSRLYVVDKQLRQITRDHSLVQEMVRMGEITAEEARNHPDKNIITRALGAEKTVDVDFFDMRLEPGSTILMCSDGLSNMVEDKKMEEIIFAACRGGWPATLNLGDDKSKLLVAKEYVKSVYKNDISRIDGVKRNQKLAHLIMKSYARNISTLAKTTSILADVTASDDVECTRPTLESYIEALEKLFVIQDIEAWCPSIRSKTTIQSRPKRAFCDPSVAVALLNLSPESLMTQLKTFGFIFEQMCARDLRVYSASHDSRLSYYRDRYGLEADLVLHLDDGRYALIECKLGSREIEEGAKHLLEIKRLIQVHNETEKQVPLREPDLMIVMTGGSMAYTRPDGVKVIPLACLKD